MCVTTTGECDVKESASDRNPHRAVGQRAVSVASFGFAKSFCATIVTLQSVARAVRRQKQFPQRNRAASDQHAFVPDAVGLDVFHDPPAARAREVQPALGVLDADVSQHTAVIGIIAPAARQSADRIHTFEAADCLTTRRNGAGWCAAVDACGASKDEPAPSTPKTCRPRCRSSGSA